MAAPTLALPRPADGEYDPAAAAYVALAPTMDDPPRELASQRDRVADLFSSVTEDRAAFRYATGKWTVREILGHMTDAERIFAYRLLRIGRGDETPLPGFDETIYVPEAAFERRSLHDVIDEWTIVRNATIALVKGMPPGAWTRRGVANEQRVSARGLLYVIAGHVEHHLKVLRERYGI
jgi:DinB family protein